MPLFTEYHASLRMPVPASRIKESRRWHRLQLWTCCHHIGSSPLPVQRAIRERRKGDTHRIRNFPK